MLSDFLKVFAFLMICCGVIASWVGLFYLVSLLGQWNAPLAWFVGITLLSALLAGIVTLAVYSSDWF